MSPDHPLLAAAVDPVYAFNRFPAMGHAQQVYHQIAIGRRCLEALFPALLMRQGVGGQMEGGLGDTVRQVVLLYQSTQTLVRALQQTPKIPLLKSF